MCVLFCAGKKGEENRPKKKRRRRRRISKITTEKKSETGHSSSLCRDPHWNENSDAMGIDVDTVELCCPVRPIETRSTKTSKLGEKKTTSDGLRFSIKVESCQKKNKQKNDANFLVSLFLSNQILPSCYRVLIVVKNRYILLGFYLGYLVLLAFVGFYLVLNRFHLVLLGFMSCRPVFLGCTGFSLVLPSFTGFCWVLPSFERILPGFIEL